MAKTKKPKTPISVDFLIVSIIPDLELKSVLNEFSLYYGARDGYSSTKLEAGLEHISFTGKDGEAYSAVVAAIYEAGNVSSAVECASLLTRFNPGFVVLCGIGGNVFPDRTKKGDVVVAKHVKYERISRVSQGLDYEFTSPPIVQPDDVTWKDIASYVSKNEIDFLKDSTQAVDAITVNKRKPKIDFGQIYCSHMVVDCSDYRTRIQDMDREMRAVEMEAGGFLLSVAKYRKHSEVNVPTLILRGISDDCANKRAEDEGETASPVKVDWRGYAAQNSSRLLAHYLDNIGDEVWE